MIHLFISNEEFSIFPKKFFEMVSRYRKYWIANYIHTCVQHNSGLMINTIWCCIDKIYIYSNSHSNAGSIWQTLFTSPFRWEWENMKTSFTLNEMFVVKWKEKLILHLKITIVSNQKHEIVCVFLAYVL